MAMTNTDNFFFGTEFKYELVKMNNGQFTQKKSPTIYQMSLKIDRIVAVSMILLELIFIYFLNVAMYQ